MEEETKNKRLEAIKARCLNWYYCYRDKPRFNVSNLYFVIKYLETYNLGGKQGESEENTRLFKYRESNLRPAIDHRDADILQQVWQGLDQNRREPLMVGVRFHMVAVPISEIKRIIAVFVFGGKRYKYLSRKRRRALNVSVSTYETIEDLALLYFARAVEENQQK